ncbi:MAG: sugar ABC transporter permease [Nitrososphaerota archaeon]
MGPSLILIISFYFIPAAYAFYISLLKYNLMKPQDVGKFAGLNNYISVLTSDLFQNSLIVSIKFTLLSILLIFIIGLGIALLLNKRAKGRDFLTLIILIPWAIPLVSASVIWQWMLDPAFGWLNGILTTLKIIPRYQFWLSEPTSAFMSLVLAHVWKSLPFTIIVLLAALQSVPSELLDSAAIDGASSWQKFLHITLPWIRSSILVILLLNTFWTLQSFDLVYNLTQGGPGNATQVLPLFIWLMAFSGLDMGLANALAFILLIISFILALIYIAILYRREM